MIQARRRTPRRSFPIAWIMLALLAGAAFLLAAALYHHTGRNVSDREDIYIGSKSDQAILLLAADSSGSSRRYYGLQTALADTGISSLYLQLSTDHAQNVTEQIEQAMERLARLSGRPAEYQWLLAESDAAAILAEHAGQTASAGLIFLCPAELDSIPASVWTAYPDKRPTIIVTGMKGAAADQAISLFEQQTGEDARLFSGASAPGWFSAEQFRSVDGRFVLRRYPFLRSPFSSHDIRIIADLSSEMAAYDPATAERIRSISAAAALSQLIFLRYYLLLGLLILSLPVVFTIASRRKMAELAVYNQPACFSPRSSWISGLFWLPAAAMCAGLIFLINQWVYTMKSPWTGMLFFLPGCYGLVSWIGGWINRQHRPALPADSADQLDFERTAPGKVSIVPSVLVCTLLILVFLVWRWLMFGWSAGLRLSPLLMVIFFIWNVPGEWADQPNRSARNINQHRIMLPVWFLILRNWPYLVLLILIPFMFDGAAFLILLILLAFLYWSDVTGKTVTILTGRCWIGRLVRALLLTISWFHPALLPSVFY